MYSILSERHVQYFDSFVCFNSLIYCSTFSIFFTIFTPLSFQVRGQFNLHFYFSLIEQRLIRTWWPLWWSIWSIDWFLYPLQTLFVGGILFSRCPSVRLCVRPSVTLCFLNNSKSHCWIFIKPCKHVHICKTNTLDKKVRARGQFYLSYFPL